MSNRPLRIGPLQALEQVVQVGIVPAPLRRLVQAATQSAVAPTVVWREKPADADREAGRSQGPKKSILSVVVDVTEGTGPSLSTFQARKRSNACAQPRAGFARFVFVPARLPARRLERLVSRLLV